MHYEIRLKLDVPAYATPRARVWVDSDLPGDLDSETELALVHDGAGDFRGSFPAACGRFIYRVAMLAEPGTRWSLSIRSHDDAVGELIADSDVTALAKEWLVGMCEDASESPLLDPNTEPMTTGSFVVRG